MRYGFWGRVQSAKDSICGNRLPPIRGPSIIHPAIGHFKPLGSELDLADS